MKITPHVEIERGLKSIIFVPQNIIPHGVRILFDIDESNGRKIKDA